MEHSIPQCLQGAGLGQAEAGHAMQVCRMVAGAQSLELNLCFLSCGLAGTWTDLPELGTEPRHANVLYRVPNQCPNCWPNVPLETLSKIKTVKVKNHSALAYAYKL